VAAAVILPDKIYIEGLNDSKKLSAKRREGLYEKIYNLALDIGVGMANSQEIDRINILQATYSAMRRAYKNLSITPQYLLLDAVVIPDLKVQQEGVIHGDSLCGSIAAASIVAKVTRDRIMEELDESYPQYGFAQHKGYPTKRHIQAIEKYGPCAVHRRTFSRVKEWCFP